MTERVSLMSIPSDQRNSTPQGLLRRATALLIRGKERLMFR
jgi:hypothetical protein